MGLLNPAYTPSVPFQRPTEDNLGNTTWADLGDTPAVVALASSGIETGVGGPVYTQSGTIFIQRGVDRKAGDRFTYQGFSYTLVGVAQGDMVHPFTGDDFGWVAFAFAGGETRWT